MSFIKQKFHKLISYRFKNDENLVKTAYLDTYFREYENKSGTGTYTLHQHAFLQFANYFIEHPIRFTQAQLEIIFQYLTSEAIKILNYYNQDIIRIINDYTESAYIHIFISQILQKYNNTIYSLEQLFDKLQNIKIYLLPTIRHHYPKPIHSYQYREKVLTHKKGHRGFVSDYDYYTYW